MTKKAKKPACAVCFKSFKPTEPKPWLCDACKTGPSEPDHSRFDEDAWSNDFTIFHE